MELLWLIFCFGVGYYAKERGRNPFIWGVAAFIFSPILAGVVLAMLKDDKQATDTAEVKAETQQLKDRVAINETSVNNRLIQVEEKVQRIEKNGGNSNISLNTGSNQQLLTGDTKFCPQCGSEIKKDAIKCRYCGAELKEVKMVECPFCKELIRADALKCKYCRSDIPQQQLDNSTVAENSTVQ